VWIGGLISNEDSVITTVAEHNSVLRPLYLTGCDLNFMDCDDDGNLRIDTFEKLLKPSTKYFFCTHGSNVTGNIADAKALYSLCKANGITLILDVAQTFGAVPVDIGMADIFCFTGHKSLLGPQGTGGVIANGKVDFRITKTGGAGSNSFDTFQPAEIPDIFEVGTLNSPGIFGLQKGVGYINEVGLGVIQEKQTRLLQQFYEGVRGLAKVKIYGDLSTGSRLPIASLNIDGLTSSELAERLWEGYGIATRAGSHCAPLLHIRFGTEQMGMVRFSFSYYNTEEEIQQGVCAVKEIVGHI